MADFTINIDEKFAQWYTGANILFQHNGCDIYLTNAFTLGIGASGAQIADFFIFDTYDYGHATQTLWISNFSYSDPTTFYLELNGSRILAGEDFYIDVLGLAPGDPIPGLTVVFNNHYQPSYGNISFTAQMEDTVNVTGSLELIQMNSDSFIC